MGKVLTIVGARPQFIKAFPVSEALRGTHEEVLVHTGQHYDEGLSDVFFEELAIPEPDHHLGVGSASHATQTAEMMTGIEALIDEESPDVVLVYGDTNSTLAGAIVAAKEDVTLAHVEAGLRSRNWSMPEEVNRVLTDHSSDLLFATSEDAARNLRAEGITEGVHVTGDVMQDAILHARDRAAEHSSMPGELNLSDGEYVLATVHRAGNTDDPDRLDAILSGLAASPRPVVFPAHPRTVAALQDHGLWGRYADELRFIEPVGYLDFVRLIDGAERVATDSGGVQKEAFYLDTPCVTLRDETEWTETVEAGWNVLVGADESAIRGALSGSFEPVSNPPLYGDGTAAETIRDVLDDA